MSSTQQTSGARSSSYTVTRRIHNPQVDFVTGSRGEQPVVRYEAYDRDQQRIVSQIIPAPTVEAANQIVRYAVEEEGISPMEFRAAAARISSTAQVRAQTESIRREIERQQMEGGRMTGVDRPGIAVPEPASDPMFGSIRGRHRRPAPEPESETLESEIESFLSSTEHPSVSQTSAVTEEDRASLLAERNEHAVKSRSLRDLEKQRQAQRDFFRPSAFDLRTGKFRPVSVRTTQTGDSRIPRSRYVSVGYERPREGWEVLSTYALAPVSRSSFSVATDAKSVFTPAPFS